MATHVLIVVQDGMVYISTQVHSIYNPYLRPADEYIYIYVCCFGNALIR